MFPRSERESPEIFHRVSIALVRLSSSLGNLEWLVGGSEGFSDALVASNFSSPLQELADGRFAFEGPVFE